MSRSDWATLIAVAATIISFALLLPQIIRLWRTGRTEGVSPAWAATGASSNVGWLVYILSQELWIVLPSVAVASIQFLLTFWLLYRNHAPVRAGAIAGIVTGTGYAVIGITFGWTVLGTVLAFSYAIQYAPSVMTAWRTWAPIGISPVTWIISVAEAMGWGVYGILIEEAPIIIFGIVSGLSSFAVLSRLWVTRGRDPELAALDR